MVAQPRRIAARALKDYVGRSLGPVVGLRMGGGVREETADSCIYFVTTGYLMQYMIHKQHTNVTHLIIDEVHERSIAADVLCYLMRKMLINNPALRLILMSATMFTDIYRDYFTSYRGHCFGDLNSLHVGVRRFESTVMYLEDLCERADDEHKFNNSIASVAKRALRHIGRLRVFDDGCVLPTMDLLNIQYNLVQLLIDQMCPLGSGVLVFVSGIMDMHELSERLKVSKKYKLFFLHSQIPVEDQPRIFLPPSSHAIKVVIATNAGESSITIPDIDCVICFGLNHESRLNLKTHHRQMVKCWISQASAIQRAGRTGRVREGVVFRLYTRSLFESFESFNRAEITTTPLEDTILDLRGAFESSPDFEGVVPVLENLIEPPDTSTVEIAFSQLYINQMISEPSEDGCLTDWGKFCSQIPYTLRLKRMIALGICMGIGMEAVVMAASISRNDSIFHGPFPFLYKDASAFNTSVVNCFLRNSKSPGGDLATPKSD